MKQKIFESLKFILQIFLTALASALIAMLQAWIESHGTPAGPTITPENTAVIGAGVATLRATIKIA